MDEKNDIFLSRSLLIRIWMVRYLIVTISDKMTRTAEMVPNMILIS
jgi:hypothetical protein